MNRIDNLHAAAAGKEILEGIALSLASGEAQKRPRITLEGSVG